MNPVSKRTASYSTQFGLMAQAKAMDERKNEAILAIAKDIAKVPDEQKWYPYDENVEVSVIQEDNNKFLLLYNDDDKYEDGNLRINLKDVSGIFTRVNQADLDDNVRHHYLNKAKEYLEKVFEFFH